MNREQFMERLAQLLSDISVEERQEALAYYASYFEDAGEENEALIIQELESPEKVANTIKEGLTGDYGLEEKTLNNPPVVSLEKENRQKQEQGAYTENAYNTYSQGTTTGATGATGAYGASGVYGASGNSSSGDGTRVILIIVLLILTSPIWTGVLGGIAGVLIAVLVTVAALVFAGFVTGIACAGAAIGQLTAGAAAEGVALVGISLLAFAVGLICLVLLVLFCGKFLPWAIREIIGIIQRLFHNSKKEGIA